jgi:putative ABC transport system substrate-binding protein
LKVDVIISSGTPATAASKQATTNIPIVFIAVADPVGENLVANLSRPGGNLTGLSNLIGEVAGKRLELLHEAMPSLHRVAIMGNAGNPGAVLEMRAAQSAAARLGLESLLLEIRRAEGIAPSLRRCKAAPRQFGLRPTAWSLPTTIGSTRLRWPRDCRPVTASES